MTDTGIVRNRAKILATRRNAQATVDLRDDGGLEAFIDGFRPDRDPEPATAADVPTTSPESVALSKALRKRGFGFVGPTTVHALMEATGLVDTHLVGLPPSRDRPSATRPEPALRLEQLRFGPCPRTSRPPASTPSATTLSGTTTPSASPRRSVPAGVSGRRRSRPRSPAPACSTSSSPDWPPTGSPTPSRRQAAEHAGFFAGQPTFVKDNSDVDGPAHAAGHPGVRRAPRSPRRELRAHVRPDRDDHAGQDPPLRVRLQCERRVRRRAPGPQPVAHRPHLGSLLGRVRRVRRGRRGADGTCQRRWWLDPDPGGVQRSGGAQAHAVAGSPATRSTARCR